MSGGGFAGARAKPQRASALVCVAIVAALLSIGLPGLTRAATAATTPTFVQQASARVTAATATVTPTANVTAGNRLVVEVGVWNASAATASAVTDSAGNTYTKVTSFAAADDTEMSIWTAPITVGGGTKPVITARVTSSADIGVAVLEYAGLSSAAGLGPVDTQSHAVGKTAGAAATVASGATPATTAPGELALGFYADSGFGTALVGGTGYTVRTNVSPNNTMDLLVEEQLLPAAGATPSATARTGANTNWLMATVVFQSGGGTATVPSAPTSVAATAGNGSATVSWTAPGAGGSTITSYTVTPYISATAQTPTVVTGAPPATTTPISGLTNGIAYTFKVSAANAIGSGPASAASNAVTPGAAPGGQWSALQTMPIMALSSILTYNGKLVFWDGWQDPQPSVVWNPANPSAYTTINAPSSVFCDAGATLPDGRLLIAGGYGGLSTGNIGIVDTNIFDPATNIWTRAANMNQPRWYPSMTELADGRYVVLSGNTTDASHWAETPEVYDPATNKWSLLTGVSTSQIHEEEYPFSYLLPSGKVLAMGPEEDVTYTLDVATKTWTPVGPSGLKNGSSVMYRPGKILYSGGSADIVGAASRASTAVLDMTAASPSWAQTSPMANARTYHTLTMLADGQVLAVGGAANSNQQQHITTGVLSTEIWNPTTQTWSTGASMAAARNYHSTAVLLPDATVLVTGGGHPNSLSDPGQFSSQIYSPSYLSSGPRPTITGAPATATYGAPLTVTTPDAASISAVNLVSLGASTHQLDMNQHFVPLSFTAGAGSLTVNAPADGALAPPGYYMLFFVNAQGTPSVASMVKIGQPSSATVPGAPTGVTATASNATASLTWTAPNNGGSTISGYTVTPYVGGVAQTPTTVTGTPPAPSATVTGLTNGTTYTFTVTAANAVGAGPASTPSNAVTPTAGTGGTAPTFVQQKSARNPNTATLAVTPTNNVTAGNRLIVEVGVWNASHTSATSVTDSAGNTYTKLKQFQASEGTELSVWSAPITVGGGTKPVITARMGSSADVGVAVVEYSGVSPVAGASVVDVSSQATGTTSAAAAVRSGPTPPTTSANELAVGFYVDSGFNKALTGGGGFTSRVNVSPFTDMQLFVEDLVTGAGTAPNALVNTGANTTWLMATIVFKASVATPPAAPGAPTGVTASTGDRTAAVAWTAPADGGSTISSYTVTPSVAGVAQTPTTVTGSPPSSSAAVTGLTNGTAYTFTVTATNAVGTGPASAPSNAVTPAGATAPAAPIGASALPGSGSATVSWTAPTDGGSPITLYTVTPFVGAVAQAPTTVSGSPPATTAFVGGLGDGTTYTFTVTATNTVGTSPPSAPSNAVTPTTSVAPTFVQQKTARGVNKTSQATTMATVVSGNRLIVEVGVWGSSSPTATAVTDSAGNVYTKVLGFVASDATEMTVWTALITQGGGTALVVTATTNRTADIGVAALEYAGLSAAAGAAAVDTVASSTGTAPAAITVSSGSTPPTTAGNELAVGFYLDSGFGTTPAAGAGYTLRATVGPFNDMDFLTEDRIVGQAATPASTANINQSAVWLMGTVVFKSAAPQFSQAVVSSGDESALGATNAGTFRRARVVSGPGGTSYYCRMGA